MNNLMVQTEFQIKHFIAYLNKFHNLDVVSKKFYNGSWTIALNDGSIYVMHHLVWEKVQANVDRFQQKIEMIH